MESLTITKVNIYHINSWDVGLMPMPPCLIFYVYDNNFVKSHQRGKGANDQQTANK